jgi:SAM-dependent methyltransferase
MDQQSLTVRQFGASAGNYLTSPVHAAGADLERLARLAQQSRVRRALDLGCGAGHASFALARGGAQRVVACDPSADMLSVVAREAASRGHDALETRIGAAEVLPFESGSFDLVVTRFSAHHWADVPRAMRECARVLAPGGHLIAIDVIAPEQALLDTSLQVIEFLRDASHVRDYRASEWAAMQRAAGLTAVSLSHRWKLPMEFASWIARIGTPPERVAALRAVFARLPAEAREYFQVAADLSFTIDAAWMEAIREA